MNFPKISRKYQENIVLHSFTVYNRVFSVSFLKMFSLVNCLKLYGNIFRSDINGRIELKPLLKYIHCANTNINLVLVLRAL